MELIRRLPRRMPAVSARAFRRCAAGNWAVWRLPRWLKAFVLTVVAADLAAIGAAAPLTTFRGHDLVLFAVLLACTAIAVEWSRRSKEQHGISLDVQGVWEFPVAILLPPLFALLVPVPRLVLTQWRVSRAPLHRRIFSCASISLSYGAASLAFRGLSRLTAGTLLTGAGGGVIGRDLRWTILVTVSAVVVPVVTKMLVLTAVKGSDPSVSIRGRFFDRESLYNDSAEMCIAVLLTYAVAGNVFLAPAALPVITLLQRSLRHAQLVIDSRADSKTGLLNAATWEHEAAAEVGRAVRTKSALAVALLDIDRFKVINDTYGHLVGDQVIKEIARTLSGMLREYDMAGRFGGEEFSLLLPQTRAVDAFRIAERVRADIAGLSIIAPGATGGERVHVTVSIGVAALDSGSVRKLNELMAAADAALYRAKSGGRDQVQMISTTRGLSAISGTGRAADDGSSDVPIAFRRAQNS
jgi:diguanylate cyclase (GGDEF)-like protein